jgi:hypothetical protein
MPFSLHILASSFSYLLIRGPKALIDIAYYLFLLSLVFSLFKFIYGNRSRSSTSIYLLNNDFIPFKIIWTSSMFNDVDKNVEITLVYVFYFASASWILPKHAFIYLHTVNLKAGSDNLTKASTIPVTNIQTPDV